MPISLATRTRDQDRSPLSARERRQLREEQREERAFAARQAQQRAATIAAHRAAEAAAFGPVRNANGQSIYRWNGRGYNYNNTARGGGTPLEVPADFNPLDNWQDVLDSVAPTSESETFSWNEGDTLDVNEVLAAARDRDFETLLDEDELWWEQPALTEDASTASIYDYLGSLIDPRLPDGVSWSALNVGGTSDQPGIVAQLLMGRFETGDFRSWAASLDHAVASFFAEANEEEQEAREPGLPPMTLPFETANGFILLPFMSSHSEQQNDINRPLTAEEEAVVTTAASIIAPPVGFALDALTTVSDAFEAGQEGENEQAQAILFFGIAGMFGDALDALKTAVAATRLGRTLQNVLNTVLLPNAINRLNEQLDTPIRLNKEDMVGITRVHDEVAVESIIRNDIQEALGDEAPIVWLEQGSADALSGGRGRGLAHIWEDHPEIGINHGFSSAESLGSAIIYSIGNTDSIGTFGRIGRERPVYRIVNERGESVYMAITIGSNGYIVGGNVIPLSDVTRRNY